MRYVIVIASEPGDWDAATAEEREAYYAAHEAFERAVRARGTRIAGAALEGADTATTLRHDGSAWAVTDGPYAELVEQLSGFYLVDLPDLDAAIEVCRLLPTAYTVEIRPEMVIEGYESP